MSKPTPEQIEADKRLIDEDQGGAAALSEKLGFSFERVNNWRTRGIPADVKLAHPKVFLPHLFKGKQRQAA